MFSRPWSRTGNSPGTQSAVASRSDAASTWRRFTPPSRISPSIGSSSRTSSWASVLLPTPVGPTIATDSSAWIRKVTSSRTRDAGEAVRERLGRASSGPSGNTHRLGGWHDGDRLGEDLFHPRVTDDRARELGQDPADEAHRPGEHAEQRDQLHEVPTVTAPVETRHEPTAIISGDRERRAAPRAPARTPPGRTRPAMRSSRSRRAFTARRSVSAASRPRAFTTARRRSISCATEDTSPMRSWARSRRPLHPSREQRFMIASAGIMSRPTIVRNGSVEDQRDHRERDEEDHADGERDRVQDVDRRLDVGLHVREQLAGRRRLVVASERSRYRSETRSRSVALMPRPRRRCSTGGP